VLKPGVIIIDGAFGFGFSLHILGFFFFFPLIGMEGWRGFFFTTNSLGAFVRVRAFH